MNERDHRKRWFPRFARDATSTRAVDAAHCTDSANSAFARLLREPTLHFFAIAAVILMGQRLMTSDERTIEITPELKADLLRRYQDQLNRPPTSAEAEAFMTAWKLDEALYREAIREEIDRDDATVRNVVVTKMRERLLLQTRMREPTAADLQQYLEQHRNEFEAPLIFEHEYVTFPKAHPKSEQEREKYERQLAAGATPASLGLRSTAANVNRERIEQEFGREVADKIAHLPKGQWQRLETADRLLLLKLLRIHGGLPEPEELHARLLSGWKAAAARKILDAAARGVAERYRFEEPAR